MYTISMLLSLLGYGVSYEGYDDGKIYFGVYARDTEYGWVVTGKDIYLNTILKKDLTSK